MPSKKQMQTKAKTSTKKTPVQKVTSRKGLAKKVVKKSPAKKVVKKASAKKVVKKSPAKKVVKKASAKKVVKKSPAKQYVRITPEELFDGINLKATQIKDKDLSITFDELFGDVNDVEQNLLVQESIAQQAPTTPAYSQIIRSTLPRPTNNQKVEDGAQILFEQEEGEFFERLNLFHKLALLLGIAIFMIVIGGLWFQVTKGYFEETSQNKDSAIDLLQETLQQNKQQFQQVTSQIQQRVQMAQDEFEGDEKLQQEINLITEELRKQLQEQSASNDTTQN